MSDKMDNNTESHCRAKTVALVYAWFITVKSVLGVIIAGYFVIWLIILMIQDKSSNQFALCLIHLLLISVMMMYMILSTSFGVHLIKGINEKNPNNVWRYFVYGVSMTILWTLVGVIFAGWSISDGAIPWYPALIILPFCALSIFFLYTIYRTYKHFSGGYVHVKIEA